MQGRSIFNPFGSHVPLKSFGSIRVEQGDLKYDGLPYVGPVFPFKDDDPEEFQPQKKHNGCCAQFDLSDKEDMAQYRALCQKICDGLAQVSYEEKIYDDDIKSWRILIRWMEPYYAPPPAAQEIIKNIKDGKDPKVMQVMPETDTRQPQDLAEVVAETAPGTDQTGIGTPVEQEPKNDRYTTIDQALRLAGGPDAADEGSGSD